MSARRIRIGRVQSLDAVRGVLVLAVVAGLTSVTLPIGVASGPWGPIGGADLVEPAFATVLGCAFGLAQHRGWLRGWRMILRIVLVLAGGMLISLIAAGLDPAETIVTGSLQMLALVMLLLAIAGTWARSWGVWLLTTFVLAVGVAAVHWWWATSCPDGVIAPGCSASVIVDGAFGMHGLATSLGYDPHGVVAAFGALVGACAGAALAHALLRARSVPRAQTPRVVAYAIGTGGLLSVIGVVTHFAPTLYYGQALQPIPALLTPPLTLAVAAVLCVAAAILHPVLDRDLRGGTSQIGGIAQPFAAVGRLSFAIVLVAGLLRAADTLLPDGGILGWLHGTLGGLAQAAVPVAAMLAVVLVAWLVERRGIRLRP